LLISVVLIHMAVEEVRRPWAKEKNTMWTMKTKSMNVKSQSQF